MDTQHSTPCSAYGPGQAQEDSTRAPKTEMPDIDDKLLEAYETLGIRVGDIFEDCAFHPVLCLGADYREDDLWGISLIDGTYPRSCSFIHCGVRKLSLEEAWSIKSHGPSDAADAELIDPDRRWWSKDPSKDAWLEPARTILPSKLPTKESTTANKAADPTGGNAPV